MSKKKTTEATKTERYYCREFWGDKSVPLWRHLGGEYKTLAEAKKAAREQNERAGKGNRVQVIRRTLEVAAEVKS